MKGIPLYGETELASGMDFAGLLGAHVQPTEVVARIGPDHVVPTLAGVEKTSGIISAIELQRYAMAYKRQIAQVQPQDQHYIDEQMYRNYAQYGSAGAPASSVQSGQNAHVQEYSQPITSANGTATYGFGNVEPVSHNTLRNRSRIIEVPAGTPSAAMSPSETTAPTASPVTAAELPGRAAHM